MKSGSIVIAKHENIKKRSTPLQIKRKVAERFINLPPPQSFINKLQYKHRSTSKSQEKDKLAGFSKGFLITNQHNKSQYNQKNISHSNQRIKTSSKQSKNIKSLKSPYAISKVQKSQKIYRRIPQYKNYYSADKQQNRPKPNSKTKSYLLEYMDRHHKTSKAQSVSRLKSMSNQQKSMSENIRNVLKQFKYGFRTRQGVLITNPNKTNQDNFLIKSSPNENTHIFAVADGHGQHGHYVSQLSISSLQKFYDHKYKQFQNSQSFFKNAFNNIQNQLFQIQQFNAHTSGSTMISLIIENNMCLTCANVGDSRAILARQIDKKNWEIIHLSEDHKPSLEKQKKRILKKGGKIHCFKDERGNSIGPQRVWLPNQNLQGLAMSRSLGDNISKPIGVSHQPQVIQVMLQQKDKFIVLASDGVWQFIKNFEILQLVVPYYKQGKIEECCDAMMKLAYERWTVEDDSVIDDITFILIFLNQ